MCRAKVDSIDYCIGYYNPLTQTWRNSLSLLSLCLSRILSATNYLPSDSHCSTLWLLISRACAVTITKVVAFSTIHYLGTRKSTFILLFQLCYLQEKKLNNLWPIWSSFQRYFFTWNRETLLDKKDSGSRSNFWLSASFPIDFPCRKLVESVGNGNHCNWLQQHSSTEGITALLQSSIPHGSWIPDFGHIL